MPPFRFSQIRIQINIYIKRKISRYCEQIERITVLTILPIGKEYHKTFQKMRHFEVGYMYFF